MSDSLPVPAGTSSPHSHAHLIAVARAQFEDFRDGTTKRADPSAEQLTAMRLRAVTVPGYQLEEELGRGGQGVVFRALQTGTGRQVAIKIVAHGPLASIADRARFNREVRILARLHHPNIVTIHDSGAAEGFQYFVMSYINGPSLEVFFAHRRHDVRSVLTVFAQVCEAVDAAHVRGIIHRDLKPANIRVDAQGCPHVLDFGLAKPPEPDDDAGALTATDGFVGSLPWASPEQVSRGVRGLDTRSDVYSLGVTLYQALVGRSPYDVTGTTRTVMERIVSAPPRLLRSLRRDIDDELETIVSKSLAKEPERRYQTAGELARDLRNYLSGEAINAKRDSGWYVLRKQLRRHRTALLVASAFAALLIVSSAVSWTLYLSARNRLWESYLAQARAGRTGERIGRRVESLDAIRAARELHFGPELRDEAVACLMLTDLQRTKLLDQAPSASATGLNVLDRFACAFDDGRIDVRSTADGARIAAFESPGGRAVTLNFSADGERLAAKHVGETDATLSVWSVAAGECQLREKGPAAGSFGQSCFSPDGRRVAFVDAQGAVAVRALDEIAPTVHVTPGFDIRDVSFDPAGAQLVLVAARGPHVVIWDLDSNSASRTLSVPIGPLSAAWRPDGQQVAVGCANHSVFLFDLSSQQPPIELVGHSAQVARVRFNASGDRLVSWGWDDQTRIWDLRSRQSGFPPLIGGRFCGLGKQLAHGQDQHLNLWDFVEVAVVRERSLGNSTGVRSGALLGERHVLCGESGGASIWTIDRVNDSVSLQVGDVRSLVASPDERGVYGVIDGHVTHWALDRDTEDLRVDRREVVALPNRALDIGLSTDGQLLIACGYGRLQVLDLNTGALRHNRDLAPGAIQPRLSPDQRYAFLGNWKGEKHRAHLIDLHSGTECRHFAGEHVIGRFSPNGRWLGVSTSEQTEIWSLETDSRCYQIPRAPGQGTAGPLAFSSDSRILALTCATDAVHLMDASSGTRLVRLPNSRLSLITDLSFSRDDRFLLVTTSSPLMYVWDLQALRRELRALQLDW